MANLLFARPGTLVVEIIMSENEIKYESTMYHRLCSIVGCVQVSSFVSSGEQHAQHAQHAQSKSSKATAQGVVTMDPRFRTIVDQIRNPDA